MIPKYLIKFNFKSVHIVGLTTNTHSFVYKNFGETFFNVLFLGSKTNEARSMPEG